MLQGETWFVTKTTLKFIGSMFKGKGDSSQLGGPIRIAKITGQVSQFGIIAFLSIMAYISISLGLINLFPNSTSRWRTPNVLCN